MNNSTKLRCACCFFLLFYHVKTTAQDPLNRSVQVSMEVLDPYAFHFSWEWDWSDGGYTVYRKLNGETSWGDPIAELPWGSVEFTDADVENGVAYEYAFFKKKFEKIVTEVELDAGVYYFKIENIYGDGICCNFGFGWYELEVCSEVVASGSDFGFSETQNFVVCANNETLTLTINPDMQVNNTWWNIYDVMGNVVATSGPPGTWLADRPKYGYILAGTKLPAVENRGSLLLLVDDVYSQPLATEIEQLESDLIGDGWKVIRWKVNRNDPVTAVKSLIVNEYNQTPDLKMLYLLGHVPVPYSGSIYPDGHSENHWGAWAADVYYGDVDGVWTDETVTNTAAQFSYNHNVPGDGKFDQSAIPSGVELAVGRVDLYDMPAFGLSDVELTRRYLNKAHLFKTGQRSVERRALVDDNLNIVLASPAASGWRNFAPMFHHENVEALDYFSTMKNESYLWSYGCGSGSHTSANGIGTTQDFANDSLKNIFTMLLGSQFGDWDNTNNFLKAPLASPGWTLTNCWAGNPPYTFHRMAMGEPIGYGLLHTQNATEEDYYPGPQLVHTSLMGDPTLRLHPVKPPTNLVALSTANTIELQWTAPSGETLAGYYVYRADSLSGPFTRINTSLVAGTAFTDAAPLAGSSTYMVRAVKLETSGSGTYWNLSLGTFAGSSFDPCASAPFETAIFPAICEGEVFDMGGSTYSTAGVYEANFTSTAGCDSVVTIHLSVLPSVQVDIDTFFGPPGLEIFGNFYSGDTTLTVVLAAANGCDSVVTAHLFLVNGIKEQARKPNLSLFPNPTCGQLSINMPGQKEICQILLIDGVGRLISENFEMADNQTLDVSDLPEGVYFIKIQIPEGSFCSRFVLSK
ncbi:MAG: T9SS type A sorting domain-containing protein [Lewinellaceae bacterium]|nr:T9SS type A sorting domain-containing protein [Saprospiraceae bacterium]MCB9339916.1 T9SS type A sorting domain-containing protein [Lewinellaceae bacterium]